MLCTVIGILAGTASALFLVSLDWVGQYREANMWLLALIPLVGLVIGLIYFYLGKEIESGNNLIIENIHIPTGKRIPVKMAPWVLITTLLTHLVGGSAGREGTAIQMSGSLADQLTRIIKLTYDDRKILLIASIAAGFASVFGTPLAGAFFGLEVFLIGKIRYQTLLPALFAALIADYTTQHIWHVGHTTYVIDIVPTLTPTTFAYAIVAGVCFGLTALLFIKSMHALTDLFKSVIIYPPLRPVVGGVFLTALFYALYTLNGSTKFIGLGIPSIIDAFQHPAESYDFLLKLFFTVLTLSCGFKGGEVTPLFFIGATLGSALSLVIPLPTALLAGMGFVAVFAGATNTPIACILMAIELFGSNCGVFVAIACVIGYLCSGDAGIYTSQIIGQAKLEALKKE